MLLVDAHWQVGVLLTNSCPRQKPAYSSFVIFDSLRLSVFIHKLSLPLSENEFSEKHWQL